MPEGRHLRLVRERRRPRRLRRNIDGRVLATFVVSAIYIMAVWLVLAWLALRACCS